MPFRNSRMLRLKLICQPEYRCFFSLWNWRYQQISMEELTKEDVKFSYSDVKRDMAAVGLSHKYPFSSKTYINSVVSFAGVKMNTMNLQNTII